MDAPAPPARFIARWDLDKTYLRTDFATLRDLVRTALERPDQKRTVPGAASLLRELSSAGGAIHILSGSPRQMRGRIEEKLRLDGARIESLTLKPNLENALRLRFRALRDQLGYKLPALLGARVALPPSDVALPEVLLGDDSEADAFVYSLYADVCAGVIDAAKLARILEAGRAYENNITDALAFAASLPRSPCVRRILIHLDSQTAPSRFVAYGPRVVPFYNYLQAAFVLAEDGFLPPSGVVRVAVELVLDHRFDADGLARSFLELRRRGHVTGRLLPALRAAIEAMRREARLDALDEVAAMCDPLEQQLAASDPGVPPAEVPRDYVALVTHHNPRRR